jgi:bile acid transporter
VVTPLEQILLLLILVLIMLGMGASLTPRDFLSALRRPWGLLIGWATQFGVMPFLAFLMVVALGLPPEAAVGALIMGSVPGGTTSNIFAYFSKGNLALSVMMTTNSTIWALVMTPLALYIYGGHLVTGDLEIPIANIAVTLAVLLVPVALAMVIRRYNANVGAVMEMMGGLLGIVIILFLIVTWVPRNWPMLATTPWPVYFVTIGLGLFGIAIGYGLATLLRLHPMNARTVALETGIQNGPLAIGIVILSFAGEQMNQILVVPALYSLFIVFVATFVTLHFRRVNLAEEQKIPSLL